MMNTHPEPTAAMSRPAAPGPMSLAALKEAELRPTALDSCVRGTRSPTKVWRAGASKAVTTPSARANP